MSLPPYKVLVRRQENYSGEHREWLEEIPIPEVLVAQIVAAHTEQYRSALARIASARLAGWGVSGAVKSFEALTAIARSALDDR